MSLENKNELRGKMSLEKNELGGKNELREKMSLEKRVFS